MELVFDFFGNRVLCFDAVIATRGSILRGCLVLALAATPLALAGTGFYEALQTRYVVALSARFSALADYCSYLG